MPPSEGDSGRPPPPSAGAWPAVIVIALTLLVISVAKLDGFARPHYLAALALQGGALLLLLIEAFPWARRPLPYRGVPAAALFALYGLLCVASCWWAPPGFRYLSLIGSVTAVQGVVWALLVSRLVRDERSLRWVLRAAVAAGALAAVAGILYVAAYHAPTRPPFLLRLFTGPGATLYADFSRAIEEVMQVDGHRNFLAIFLLPPLLICLAELFAKPLTRGAASRGFLGCPIWLTACLAGVILLTMLLCKSWGALIGLAGGMACLAAMRLSRRWRLALFGAALAMGIAAVLALSSSAVQDRMVTHAQGTRLFMWKGTVRMVGERPLLGWGTGMFMPFFPDFKPVEPMRYGWLTVQTIYPHDEPLLVGIEVGLLGLALYLAAHLLAGGAFIKRQESSPDPALRLAGWAVLAGVLAMFLHGLIEVALRFWAPAGMYWTMIGLLMALPCIIRPPDAPPRRQSRILGAAGFALAVLVVALLGKWLVLDGARSEWLMGAGGNRTSAEGYAESQVEAARRSRYVPDVLVSLGLRAALLENEAAKAGTAEAYEQAIEAYEAIYAISPGYLVPGGSARYKLGVVHLGLARVVGPADPEAGLHALRLAHDFCNEAIRQNPYDAFSRSLMADIQLQASARNLPEALDQLRQGVSASNAASARRFLLASLARAERALPEGDQRGKEIEEMRTRLSPP